MLKIKIAGHVFGLENQYDLVRFMCSDYLTDDEPEVVFSISEDNLTAFDNYNNPETREHYALHGKIANWLLPHDVLLFHGSCLALDGNGILFTAQSGTGKSTHARLWRERFGDRVVMINDDKPLIAFNKQPLITGLHGLENFDNKKSVKSVQSVVESCTVWGSPWCGKEGIHTNTSALLRCILVIKRGKQNTIRRLTPKEATEQFLHQSLIPGDNFSLRLKALDLIGRLAQLPVYELRCTISQEAVTLSASALNETLQ